MEEAKAAGKLRSIGVSNMTPKIWNEFVPHFSAMPSVDQVECNFFSQQKELRALLDKSDVKLDCWYPLGHGNPERMNDSVITTIAEKYGRNAGQIILRFEVQEGFIALPKSSNPERIKSNIDIFDFELFLQSKASALCIKPTTFYYL